MFERLGKEGRQLGDLPRADQLKGLLILLVMLGHLLPGTLEENPARWLIYGFHMPVFLALSGYLASPQWLRQYDLTGFLWRLLRRPLLPWAAAMGVYLALELALRHYVKGTPVDLDQFYALWLSPPYHLWYIPVLCAHLFVAYLLALLARTGQRSWTSVMLGATTLLTVGWLVLARSSWGRANPLYTSIGDARMLEYLLWFWLGLWIRVRRPTLPVALAGGLATTGALLRLVDFWSELAVGWVVAGELALNAGLIAALFAGLTRERWPLPAVLRRVGQASLALFLWHLLPLRLLWETPLYAQRPWLTAGLGALVVALGSGAWLALGRSRGRGSEDVE